MKLLFEQRLNGLQLILALGHARHSLGQTEIHKKHLRLGLAAIWHNHNVLVVQIVDQNLAAMHLPQGLLSIWQYLSITCTRQFDVRVCDSRCTYTFS